MDEVSINIRSVQHYMYCPRRFALLELNSDWAENAFVVKANLMHENVHSGEHEYKSPTKTVVSAVSVYNDLPQYNLFGVVDVLEFHRKKDGVYIPALDGNYNIVIVEYKSKPPENADFHESDAIQVFAQKLCVDYIFKCNCECYLYYSKTRKRVKLPFDTESERYDKMLKDYLSKMREIISNEQIPDRVKGQKCSGCSLSGVCFPKSIKISVRKQIETLGNEEVGE